MQDPEFKSHYCPKQEKQQRVDVKTNKPTSSPWTDKSNLGWKGHLRRRKKCSYLVGSQLVSWSICPQSWDKCRSLYCHCLLQALVEKRNAIFGGMLLGVELGLALARQVLLKLSHAPVLYAFIYFGTGSLTFSLDWPGLQSSYLCFPP
jgi:hypothetical protein